MEDNEEEDFDDHFPGNAGIGAFDDEVLGVLEKTPFLLRNSSIPLKPWSDSSIPSVDMFTSPL